MGKAYYNRWASAYDAQTGEAIIGVNTYGMNADRIEISPHRRFVVVHSNINRLWAIVESGEG